MTTVARDGDERAIVRSATPADLPAVHALEQAVFPQPWPYAAFRRHCSDPGFLVAVPADEESGAPDDSLRAPDDQSHTGDEQSRTDGNGGGDGAEAASTLAPRAGGASDDGPEPTVLGYVVADVVPYRGGQLGHVKDLAVAPAHRGEGLGGRLFDRGLAVVGAAGADRAKLEVRADNDRALALYRSRGFEPRRRVPEYYGDGADALVLVGPVAQSIPDVADENR